MINLLLGAPGGGKSYEAVVYHIIPAIKAGRKVITNLPLNLDTFRTFYPDALHLIEIVTQTKAKRKSVDPEKAYYLFQKFGVAAKPEQFNSYPFSNLEDYGDSWRHPETGSGPLYVIDECHIALPKRGTPIAVEEWYSLHRHESADVLLITQSYGKINQAVRDLVQVCYRVRKNVALGSQNTYTRKVQDGLRGEVVNTSQRSYNPQYYKYYKSHTRGGGSELAAKDIRPIWMHWSFLGSALMLTIFLLLVFTGHFKAPWNTANTIKKPLSSNTAQANFQTNTYSVNTDKTGTAASKVNPSAQQAQTQSSVEKPKQGAVLNHPFDAMQISILGYIHDKQKYMYLIGLAQNGQVLKRISDKELVKAGYTFQPISDCSANLFYKDIYKTYIRCDSPTVSPTVGESKI